MNIQLCPYGIVCKDKDNGCKKSHDLINKQCKFGNGCPFKVKNQCLFKHEKCRYENTKNGCTRNDCKYEHSKKRTNLHLIEKDMEIEKQNKNPFSNNINDILSSESVILNYSDISNNHKSDPNPFLIDENEFSDVNNNSFEVFSKPQSKKPILVDSVKSDLPNISNKNLIESNKNILVCVYGKTCKNHKEEICPLDHGDGKMWFGNLTGNNMCKYENNCMNRNKYCFLIHPDQVVDTNSIRHFEEYIQQNINNAPNEK